jgi:tetratricopeptide (TPR) repeat protein
LGAVGTRFQRWVSVLMCLVGSVVAAEKPIERQWLKISLPELTIITSLGEPEAVSRAKDFAQYIAALRSYFNGAAVQLTPLTMVVFAQRRDFLDYRPLDKDGQPEWVGGFFLRHESWAVIALPADAGNEVRHTMFHEGAHWFADGAGSANALWINEGMAEVFSTFRVEGDQACWGEVLPQHVKLLQAEKSEPLERVVVASRDLLARDDKRTSLFYAESWAFVHMLLFGDTEVPQDGLASYNRALAAGVNPDGAFATAFGLTYQEMDEQLSRYLQGEPHHLVRQPLISPAAVRAELASPMEVDEALGRLALAGHRYAEAVARGRAMTDRAPADPRGHTLLGVARKEMGEVDAALGEFAFAARCGATDFQPYLELGNAVQTPAVERGADLSGGDARRAADYYEQAIDRYERFEGSYANLGGIVGLVEPAKDRDLAVLRAGAHLFPENAMISLGLAQWYFRSGDRPAAHALLDEVLTRTANGPTTAAKFARQLRDMWENAEFFERVSALTAAKNYEQALELIDRRPVVGSDLSLSLQVTALRRDVRSAREVNALNEAVAREQWSEARRLVAAIVASDATPMVKANVKRILATISRRELEQDQARH